MFKVRKFVKPIILIVLVSLVAGVTPVFANNVANVEIEAEREMVRLIVQYGDGSTDVGERSVREVRIISEEERIKNLQRAERTRLELEWSLHSGKTAQQALDSLKTGSIIAVEENGVVKFYTIQGDSLIDWRESGRGDIIKEREEVRSCVWAVTEITPTSVKPWVKIINANNILTSTPILVVFNAETAYKVTQTGTCEKWIIYSNGTEEKAGSFQSISVDHRTTSEFEKIEIAEETKQHIRVLSADDNGYRVVLYWPSSMEKFQFKVNVTLKKELFGDQTFEDIVVKEYQMPNGDTLEHLKITGTSPGSGSK